MDYRSSQDPEAQEREKLVPLVVEAVIRASLNYAEQEKARQTGTPEHDEDGDDDLTGMMVARESECDDG